MTIVIHVAKNVTSPRDLSVFDATRNTFWRTLKITQLRASNITNMSITTISQLIANRSLTTWNRKFFSSLKKEESEYKMGIVECIVIPIVVLFIIFAACRFFDFTLLPKHMRLPKPKKMKYHITDIKKDEVGNWTF